MNLQADEIPGEEKPVVLTPVVEPRRVGLTIQHWMLLIGVCAIATFGAIALGWWVFGVAAFLLLAAGVGAVATLIRRASTRKQALLWVLAIAAERSMPMSEAILAFSDRFGRSFRWRVRLLASCLNDGLPLSGALRQVPGAASKEVQVLVRTGESTGQLPRALREAAGLPAARKADWGDISTRFFYLAWILFALQGINGFILYFIIPKFEAIFMDFGVPLPGVTIWVIMASHFVIKYFYLIVLIGLPIAAALLFALLVLVLNSYAMWLDMPLIDGLLRRRHSALLMRALSLAVVGRKPIGAAFEGLAEAYPSGWVRRRLLRADEDVRLGRDWVEALTARGLIRQADAAVLASAQRVGNLDWALRELAESSDRRLGYRLQFWLQFLFPLVVLAEGALVGLLAVAYFLPLVALIMRLAG